ncbi:MAG: Gfo/Idh/MocA family oxidoreductase [Verrucomicrobia bacterium]|nr:Gfo/Idh/MocA family oxidoreductase [Verrucomicrobiota bacterium]
MSTVNLAIVGLGFMGVTHLKAYRKIPNARLVAVCDAVRLPVDGVLAAAGGNIGSDDAIKLDMTQVKATKNLDDLLADPGIDLIDLCVPTLAHPKLSIAALQAGKHVLCEKPLARTAAAARDIVAAATAAKGFFMPAMCIRFWPEYVWLKRAIDQKTYGRCLAARFRRVSEPPAWGREHFFDGAKSGGAILDLHIHDADFVQCCFGRPKAVYAQGFTHYSGEIDHVVAQYQVASGATVSAEGGWVMTEGHGFEMSFNVIFENATADYNCTRGADGLRLFEKGQKPRTITPEPGDGYLGELSYMIDCIASHRAPSIVTGRDGASAVEICEAENESIKTGKIVAL